VPKVESKVHKEPLEHRALKVSLKVLKVLYKEIQEDKELRVLKVI
jgi:hypothetical protein